MKTRLLKILRFLSKKKVKVLEINSSYFYIEWNNRKLRYGILKNKKLYIRKILYENRREYILYKVNQFRIFLNKF